MCDLTDSRNKLVASGATADGEQIGFSELLGRSN
jgi:hypothetical protein